MLSWRFWRKHFLQWWIRGLLGFVLVAVLMIYMNVWHTLDWWKFLYSPHALPLQSCQAFHSKARQLLQGRGGRNGSFSSSSSSSSSSIVRIIHQTWKSSQHLPQRFQRWSATWKRCFPHWQHVIWSDADNRCLIQEFYSWFLPTYDSYPYQIHRVDAARYFYMHLMGGLYTDLDNECVRPFEHLLPTVSGVILGAMDSASLSSVVAEGYVQNSFMYSSPHHPLWPMAFTRLLRRHLVRTELLTGPEILMQSIVDYRELYVKQNDIIIYPGRYFNPFSWSAWTFPAGCRDLNKMTYAEELQCRNNFLNTSYVIQYHAQSWYQGRAT